MAKTLVVYYSRSGTTETVAHRLAAVLGADLEALEPVERYRGLSGFLRCIFQATRRESPLIAPGRDPSAYGLVVIGSPIWAGCLAAPVRAYLTANRDRLPELAAFCTSDSGAANPVFDQVREIVGHPLRGSLSLSREIVASGGAEREITRWVDSMGGPRATPSAIAA